MTLLSQLTLRGIVIPIVCGEVAAIVQRHDVGQRAERRVVAHTQPIPEEKVMTRLSDALLLAWIFVCVKNWKDDKEKYFYSVRRLVVMTKFCNFVLCRSRLLVECQLVVISSNLASWPLAAPPLRGKRAGLVERLCSRRRRLDCVIDCVSSSPPGALPPRAGHLREWHCLCTGLLLCYKYFTLMGQTFPVSTDKNILGVSIDRGWTFRQHTQDINARAKSRLNVMKALSAASFGHWKESLTALYEQFVRPVLAYGSRTSTTWRALQPSRYTEAHKYNT